MQFKKHILLLLVVLLGFLLRIIWLDKVPPSLNWDEVSHGFNAYSILKTGHDEWGQSFPIANFRAYGDYPLPLNLYLTIPFIKMLGLTTFSIRLPHVLLGTLTILASYFIFWGITKRKSVSLLGTIFVAIDPWLFFPSRFALQSNLSVFFLILAVAFFVNGVSSKRKYLLPLSCLSFGLTLFSYHTTRIFTPLFLLGLVVIYRQELVNFLKQERRFAVLILSILVIFFVPLPFILASPTARARANWVFLVDQGAVNQIIAAREKSTLPRPVARIIYNRPVYFAENFAQNYIGYFSPQFLFLKGGTQYQFSLPGWGLLYAVNLPFFYFGLFILIKRVVRDKNYKLALFWLLLAPLPGSITSEKFAVLRSTSMLPIPEMLTALGLVSAFEFLAKKWRLVFVIAYTLLLLGCVEKYMFNYFFLYRANYSWSWQYGYKDVVEYVKAHYEAYSRVVITKKYGEPHEFFLFYWPWDPQVYKNDYNLVRFMQSDWYWVDRFDKFYFVNDWDIPRTEVGKWKLESGGEVPMSGKVLLITSPGNYPKVGWKVIKTIHFLDGQPAFDMVTKI